jgi:hypothetical protein
MLTKRILGRRVVPVVLSCLVLSGCYLGRAPGAKKVAYVANGAIAATGGLMLAGAQGGGDEERILTNISLIPLAFGLAGIALNLAVGTEQPAIPRPLPRAVADGEASTALR